MPLEYRAIEKSFDTAAKHYEKNAVLQKEILHRLIERLVDEKTLNPDMNPSDILDLGCGTGWAIPKIQNIFPSVKIFALDFSKNMLDQIKAASTCESICGDVHDLPYPDESFDVVFSNMLLHWSNEKDVFKECMRVLKPGGLLLMSALGETSLFELKHAWKSVDARPHVHDFPALHQLGDDLLKISFQQVVVNAEVITLTYIDIQSLMRDIKASGGHNSMENRAKGLLSVPHLEILSQAYEVFRQEGRLPASYEVIYLRGIKPF